MLARAVPGASYQFERVGYFCADPKDSKPGAPVFNRTVTGGSAEVPIASGVDAGGNAAPLYPAFARVPVVVGTATASTVYARSFYQQTIARIVNANPPGRVTITAVRYTLTQIDDAMYDYYYVRNGPKDTSTLRLDVPDFTNVTGGLGVVGCMQIITRTASVGP